MRWSANNHFKWVRLHFYSQTVQISLSDFLFLSLFGVCAKWACFYKSPLRWRDTGDFVIYSRLLLGPTQPAAAAACRWRAHISRSIITSPGRQNDPLPLKNGNLCCSFFFLVPLRAHFYHCAAGGTVVSQLTRWWRCRNSAVSRKRCTSRCQVTHSVNFKVSYHINIGAGDYIMGWIQFLFFFRTSFDYVALFIPSWSAAVGLKSGYFFFKPKIRSHLFSTYEDYHVTPVHSQAGYLRGIQQRPSISWELHALWTFIDPLEAKQRHFSSQQE